MQLFYPLGNPSENIGIHKYLDTTKNQSYIPITGCILSHILSCNELSSLEKMYYILADSLSYINNQKGRNRSVSIPAKSWSKRLSCSKSKVFVLQKSLEDKGYFIIYRDKNDKGQNNRNIITSTVPDKVFNDLKYEPNRFDLGDINYESTDDNASAKLDSIDNIYIPTLEGKRQHLEKTKMFIRVPYEFLKQLNSNCSISATAKTVILFLFTKIYKSSANKYDPDDVLTHNSYSIVTSYQELQKELKLHRNSISKALRDLEDNKLISKKQFFIKDTEEYNSRASKSLWQISLLNVPLITSNNKALESAKDWGCTKYDPPCTDSGQLYIKDSLLNNSVIKNIDYIDANSKNSSVNNSSDYLQSEENYKEEFFEDKLCLSSSEFYNDSFKNNMKDLRDSVDHKQVFLSKQNHTETPNLKQSCSSVSSEYATRAIKDISEYKELRHFYPLSAQDASDLNFRANREFSSNFVNQLLLKLYIKYPDKRFKNKFTFLSYMVQILKNEKHQGPLVNHTSFRFSCNIDEEDKNMQNYEKYLTEIENSFDTSKAMQVKKKISGRFSTKLAYELLTGVEFKTSLNNRFITALIPTHLALSELQTEVLRQQLEAVYGRNKYYVDIVENVEDEEVEKGEEQEKKGEGEGISQKSPQAKNEKENKTKTKDQEVIQTFSKIPEGLLISAIPSTTAWHTIRKGLREELGEAIDKAWFAKAEAKECRETKTLTLTMPTRFMADWIRNNYSHVLRRLVGNVEIKIVEYEYE